MRFVRCVLVFRAALAGIAWPLLSGDMNSDGLEDGSGRSAAPAPQAAELSAPDLVGVKGRGPRGEVTRAGPISAPRWRVSV